MSEGYWLNARTRKAYNIHDHAMDFMESPSLSNKMGISNVYKDAKEKELKPTRDNEDRRKVVIMVMNAGYIRVRQHGTMWAFEFTERAGESLDAIREFGDKYLGDFSNMQINQLSSNGKSVKDKNTMNYQEFKKRYDEDKGLILRTAKLDKITDKITNGIIKENNC